MRFLSTSLSRPLLVLALLFSGFVAQATDYVRGRVYTRDRAPFLLLIDGHAMGPVGADFVIAALPAGYHWLEFRFPNRRLSNRVTGYRVQAWFAPGFESVYELDAFPPRARMSLSRVRCTPLATYPTARDFQWYDPNLDPGYDATYGPGYGGYLPAPMPDQPAPGAQSYYPAPGSPQCGGLLQPQDVSALVASVQSKNFEATKLSVAKQAVGGATILAEDVARLLRCFDYESTRLEFAKYAYPRCCDQRNYFKVNDAFEFESSTTELQRFTQGGR